MKINDFYPGIEKSGQKTLDRIDRWPAQGTDQANQSGRRSDQVQVSSIGREVQHYLEIARGIPDVREDRVEALQKRLQSGQYQVDPQRLAKKIVEEGSLGDFLL
jgi:negative regulator of flagellin synthesis FlgM